MKIVRIILISGALALAALLAATTWLAGTEAGLRFVLARAGAVVPGTLEVGAVQGSLVGPMVLSDVRWTQDDMAAGAAAIELDWQPLGLLKREIRLDRLYLRDIAVDLPAPAPDSPEAVAPAGQWQEMGLPWDITVQALDIESARLHRGGELLGEVHVLRGKLHAHGQSLTLDMLEFSSPQGAATGRLAASLDPREPWDVALDWNVSLPELALAGETRITGVLRDLALQQRFSQPAAADVSGRLRGLPDMPDWDLRLELQALPAGDNPWPDTLDGVSADLDINGSLEASRIIGDIAWPAVLDTSAAVDATLGWRDTVLVLDAVGIEFAPASRADFHGRVVPGPAPQVELRGRAAGITWPLQGGETLATLPALEFEGTSTGSSWRLAARGEVEATSAPPATFDLDARGDATSVRVDALEVRALGGTVAGTGTAGWQDQPSADFLLQAADLDPASLLPQWPGRISGVVHLHGALGPGQRLHVDGRDIAGELRAQPLSGAFQLALAQDSLDITEAVVALGSASLEGSGTIDREQVALRVRLDAPRLEELGPEFTGRIATQVQVAGPRTAPVIRLEADGGRLSWGNLRARVLKADANVDLAGTAPSRVQAELAGVSARLGRSATLRLEASGLPGEHAVQLEFTRRRPEQRLALALTGTLEDSQWSGQLGEFVLSDAQQELWRLQAPAELSASSDELELRKMCMDGILGLLCLEAEGLATGRWRGEAELGRLDLGPLTEWLALGLAASGEVTGTVRLAAAADRFTDLAGGFTLTTGKIGRSGQPDGALLSWLGGELTLAGDPDAANAELQLTLVGDDLVRGRLAVGWNEPDPSLQGTLEADLEQLTLVPELLPELASLDGTLGVRFSLGGTVAAPEPSGRFEWRNGEAALVGLGLTIEDIQLQADIAQGALGFRATGQSGQGRFETEGEFDLRAAGVNGRASLRGKDLTVANLPDAMVVADPDLRMSFHGERLNLGGSVHIPSALISGVGSSAAVGTSPDEVIVGEDARDAEAEGIAVTSRIEVSAGPAVQLQIGGFSGRVEGNLLTVVEPETDPWGRGELRVVDGEMSVLGQTLEIRTGRLIYDGGPLENPGIEIRAVRQVTDVTAGALVRGTLDQPQVSVFSEPPMSNAEALSYLTLGKSLEQIQSSEQQSMNQAANALALSGGGVVIEDLARRLGFRDLEVSAETDDEGSALVVGKYLGAGLYVSYGVGLFDTVNTVRLRYQVNRRLSLEAESGEEASTDLFYTFERN